MPFIFILILLGFSLPLIAKTHAEIISETAQLHEKQLLDKYDVINAPVLEKYCMDIAQEMRLKNIQQCKIIQTPLINAFMLANGHVYLSSSMMKLLKNKHQWASILAHENAHLELNHYHKMLEKYQNPGVFFPKSKIKKMHKLHESQADEWSKNTLKQYGYDSDQVYFFMQRVVKFSGNKKTYSHIKPLKRVNKNNKNEIIDTTLIDAIKIISEQQ
ncbi:MAG: M48 family metalloprotease [Marinicellaceae bacterium]